MQVRVPAHQATTCINGGGSKRVEYKGTQHLWGQLGYLHPSVHGHTLSPSSSPSRKESYKYTCPCEPTCDRSVQQASLAIAKKREPIQTSPLLREVHGASRAKGRAVIQQNQVTREGKTRKHLLFHYKEKKKSKHRTACAGDPLSGIRREGGCVSTYVLTLAP